MAAAPPLASGAPPPAEGTDAFEKARQGLVVFEFKLAAMADREIPIELTIQHPEAFDMEGL